MVINKDGVVPMLQMRLEFIIPSATDVDNQLTIGRSPAETKSCAALMCKSPTPT